MNESTKLLLWRLLPVVLIATAAAAYIVAVEGQHAFAVRNALPMAGVVLLSLISLRLGDGQWTGAGWRWPLGIIGFAIPAVGLSLYLHYAYSVDLDGMFSNSANPGGVFRYLPLYTTISGAIGFTIGWIVGSRV